MAASRSIVVKRVIELCLFFLRVEMDVLNLLMDNLTAGARVTSVVPCPTRGFHISCMTCKVRNCTVCPDSSRVVMLQHSYCSCASVSPRLCPDGFNLTWDTVHYTRYHSCARCAMRSMFAPTAAPHLCRSIAQVQSVKAMFCSESHRLGVSLQTIGVESASITELPNVLVAIVVGYIDLEDDYFIPLFLAFIKGS